ncbi:hypothetical protein LIER_42853 [Lithospermum erythrorhizon]|uniref:Uncharacterized protein n=1 Tax=Lithospermum erythrorhizon TaxID=34254 RepID=A0AAV3P4W4_LITER
MLTSGVSTRRYVGKAHKPCYWWHSTTYSGDCLYDGCKEHCKALEGADFGFCMLKAPRYRLATVLHSDACQLAS